MRWFDKYTGILRRIKLLYTVNNIIHLKDLKPNREVYKKHGINRAVWKSISSRHFDDKTVEHSSSNPSWEENGLLHLKSFYSEEFVNSINGKIEEALETGAIDFNYTQRKILFAYEKIPELKMIINDPNILKLLAELSGEEIVPFQSINFVKGSEQKAHSDSVHMATYPYGGLIAIWLALDDIEEDNGPLFYYPGSHKLPYATNKEIGNNEGWLLSPNPNKNYEEYVDKVIGTSGLVPVEIRAKKGDLIVWHANLLHGGMPHLNTKKSRKSMVVHYFMKDRVCYHELSQRPAIIKPI